MRPHIIQVADDFWNIRGSFKIGGVIDIGTAPRNRGASIPDRLVKALGKVDRTLTAHARKYG